jgi:hypothetical protein
MKVGPELSIVSRMSTEKFNRLHFFGALQNSPGPTTSLTPIAHLTIVDSHFQVSERERKFI